MSQRKPMDSSSVEGRTLLALRAGPMSSAELAERFGKHPALRVLLGKGWIEGTDARWRITESGRAACPLRNPASANVLPIAATTKIAPSRVAACGLNPEPVRRPSPAPKGVEMPQKDNHRSAVDHVRALLHSAKGGMSRKDMIKRSGLADSVIDNGIMKLIKAGEAERTGYGVIAATDKIKPVAIMVTPSAAIPAPEKVGAPTEGTIPATTKFGFTLDDEGYLMIVAGDEITLLPPTATRRLGIFLGFLDEVAWPPSFAPQANLPAHPAN